MPKSNLVYEDTKREDKEKDINTLYNEADSIIYTTQSAFPFTLYPSKITISPIRVTISMPGFFTKEEYPIPLDFIVGARLYQSLLFSSLILETFKYDAPPPVKFLAHKNAAQARRYILALVDCWQNGVDLTKYSLPELRVQLQQIGKVDRVG